MSAFSSACTSAVTACADFASRATAKTFRQDGRHDITLGALATERMAFLSAQISRYLEATLDPVVAPIISTVTWIPTGLGLIASLGRRAEKFLENQDTLLNKEEAKQLEVRQEAFKNLREQKNSHTTLSVFNALLLNRSKSFNKVDELFCRLLESDETTLTYREFLQLNKKERNNLYSFLSKKNGEDSHILKQFLLALDPKNRDDAKKEAIKNLRNLWLNQGDVSEEAKAFLKELSPNEKLSKSFDEISKILQKKHAINSYSHLLTYDKKIFNQAYKRLEEIESSSLPKLNQDVVEILKKVTDASCSKKYNRRLAALTSLKNLSKREEYQHVFNKFPRLNNYLKMSYEDLLKIDRTERKELFLLVSNVLNIEPIASKSAQDCRSHNREILTHFKQMMTTECSRTKRAYNICLKNIGKASSFFVNYSHILIDVACVTASVAMIVLGFPIPGIIGLVGIALNTIKVMGFMPQKLDEFLEPFSVAMSVVAGIIMPINIIIKAIQLTLAIDYCIKKASDHHFIKRLLPPILVGTHRWRESEKALESLATLKNSEGLKSVKTKLNSSPQLLSFLKSQISMKERLGTLQQADKNQLKQVCLEKLKDKTFIKTLTKEAKQEYIKILKLLLKAVSEGDSDNLYDQEFVEKNIDRLTLNESSIFNKETLDILPDIKEIPLEKTFSDVEERMQQLNISIDQGYMRLKEAALHGVINDVGVSNRKLLKTMLIKTLYDVNQKQDSEFIETMKEIMTIGNNCSERWVAEMGQFINIFNIHNALSKYRGKLIETRGIEIYNNIDSGSLIGGGNNVHAILAIQRRSFYSCNTYEAIVKNLMNKRGPIFSKLDVVLLSPAKKGESILKKSLRRIYKNVRQYSIMYFECFSLFLLFFKKDFRAYINGGKDSHGRNILGIDAWFKNSYNKDFIVDSLYRDLQNKQIPLDVCQELISAINEKYPWFENVDLDTYYDRTQGADGKPLCIPSKKMIHLILWHIGVLEYNKQAV